MVTWVVVAGTKGRHTRLTLQRCVNSFKTLTAMTHLRAGSTKGTQTEVMASPRPPTTLAMIRPARLGGRPPGFLANSV